ncbi:MAG: MMPL family transporter [Myxococcales bacterium]
MNKLFEIFWRLPGSPRPTVIACALLSLFFGHQAFTRLRFDTTFQALVDGDVETSERLERLEAEFGENSVFEIVIKGDVYSAPYLKKLRVLHERIATLEVKEFAAGSSQNSEPTRVTASPLPGPDLSGFAVEGECEQAPSEQQAPWIDQLESLVNARTTVVEDGALAVKRLLDPWPEGAAILALEGRIERDATLRGLLVGSRGQASVILVRPVRMTPTQALALHAALDGLVQAANQPDFHALLAGVPTLEANLSHESVRGSIYLVLATHVSLPVFLWWFFRSWIGVAGPLLVLGQAVVWTAGLMAILGVPMTVMTSMLPGFLSTVCVGDCIHMQSRYVAFRRQGHSNLAALSHTLREDSLPVVFTSLTTAAGLLSLGVTRLDCIKHLGYFAAFGVMAACLLSLVFLPAFLRIDRGAPWSTGDLRGDWVERLLTCTRRAASIRTTGFLPGAAPAAGVRRRSWAVVLVTAAISAIGLLGTSRMVIGQDLLGWLPSSHAPHEAFEVMDKHMGGAGHLVVLLHAEQGKSFFDRDILERVEAFERELAGLPEAGEIFGLPRIVRQVWRSLNDDKPEFERLPDTQRGVRDALSMFESAAKDDLRRVVTADGSKAVLIARLPWLEELGFQVVEDEVLAAADRHLKGYVRAELTGANHAQFKSMSGLIADLVGSVGSSFLVIAAMIALMLWDWKLGLLAMLPNVPPILVMHGAMGFGDVRLDSTSALVASIALGVVVDDTIHFFHHFKRHLVEHGDVERALAQTYEAVGRPAVLTCALLTCGFSTFLFVNLANIQMFGLLAGLAITSALFVDLVLTPVVLRTFYGTAKAPAEAAEPACLALDGVEDAQA